MKTEELSRKTIRTKEQYIMDNIIASYRIENIELTSADIRRCESVISGKCSADDVVEQIINKYREEI